MPPIRVAVIGAGDRGNLYSRYALLAPDEMEVVAVAEPDDERRQAFVKTHRLVSERINHDWTELLRQPKFCDAVIVTTQDRLHYAPTIEALKRGYPTLVEKPLSPELKECEEMIDLALDTEQGLC